MKIPVSNATKRAIARSVFRSECEEREVAEIADLMVPDGWRGSIIEDDVRRAAQRIYNAGFRKSSKHLP